MTNVEVLDGRPDARGGYKVDLLRGERVGRVSSEWFNRPADERYLSLADLFASVKGRSERSRTRTVESAAVRVEASRDDAERLSLILPGSDAPVVPTHWSFSQLASLVGAPAAYLRQLPAALAGINLQYGLTSHRAEQVKTLETDDGRVDLRAVTGPDYGRIYDHELVAAVQRIAGNGTGDTGWKVPGVLDWAIVLLSFFILAIQLFISLIEFKLATLCGFVLVPFGLFNKTAFMAERVLGLVISSGVKVLVLAVIVGIGSTLFGEFTRGFTGQPTIEDAMALVLAALSLLGLGIFAPGIANGIVSGGPQLGAGAAVGTGLAAGGMVVAGGAAAMGGARLAGAAVAGGARGAATVAGGASTAYQLGSQASGGSVAGGLSGVARAGASAATSPLRRAASDLGERYRAGGRAAFEQTGGSAGGGAASAAANDGAPSGEPGWARAMRRRQAAAQGVQTTAHALRSGDAGGAGSSVSVREGD